ncbi:protein FAM133-like isoform X4 [Diaphorina citri]|uniref:Protein FAM133-like isoform X4 n=1 Tax=Diaphorina citri TaxID=121845 RepID=A0A3Q0IXI9_DIACI|nr:protein FAM133-like isoform X4 [Diaphorina citri]
METLSREPTDDTYGELGSYYTPMDNRYLQYYHGYKDYKKRSSLYREEEETRQHSAHSENERELPSRDEKYVKCEVKSSSDVNVDEDSRGYHDDGCVVVKKKRKRRDRSSSDETNASTDSSVSPLKKRKRDSSRKKRKHSRKHSRRHGNETRHRKKSKHSRYHGDKVCVKRSKSPAHSSRSVSICSSQSKACSSKSSTVSSQSKSSNLSSQSKSSDRSSKSKSSNLSSQSKSSERSSQSKPCKRLKLCDSDVKRKSHREKRFKFQSDAESNSDRKPPRASSTECDYRDAKTDSSRKRSKKHRHKQKRSCSPNHRSKRCSSSVSENDSSGFR